MYEVRASVDSSLKKNTAFIKRLRTAITGSTLGAFLQDIRSLSLHKYLSEIISACYEGLCKLKSPSDVSAGVEIVSALHQRFGPAEFTGILAWFIGRGLAAPDKTHLRSLSVEVKEKEERERLSRQRNLLRVVTELWLVGALRSLNDVKPPDDAKPKSKDDTASAAGKAGEGGSKGKALANGGRVGEQRDTAPFPLEVLKEILGQDRDHANLPLVLTFLKTYAWDVLGVELQNAEERKIADEKPNPARAVVSEGEQPGVDDDDDVDNADGKASDAADGSMTSADLQQRFKNLFVQYFDGLKSHLTREQKALTAQARRNAEAYVRSGEVFEDRQSNYEKRVKAQEKLVADAQVLSQVLRLEMPDLREVDDRTTVTSTKVGLVNTDDYLRSQGEGAGIWEDEDERRFYENIVDLKERVPGILLEDGKKKTGADDQAAKKADASTESSGTDGKERLDPQTAAVEEGKRDGDAQEQLAAVASKTVGARVDAFLARLPELTSKELVDDAAVEFCFLNSKASRNRLIKALQEVPKGRTDLLPFYSRLAATLGRYMADVVLAVVSQLDSEFRSLQRRKEKDFLSRVRSSNVRYLAEMTKFGVVPEHVVFHALKICLDELSRTNVEMMCNLLENCGRYLLRTPDTSPRMQTFLETLQRKKMAQHLGQQERMLIENAIYYVNPPERAGVEQRERTPVELYVRKLVYLDMNKRNYTKVLKQFRKLHWEEREVVDILVRVFTKPGKVKYSNIHLLAILASALYRYHQDFVIGIVDDVLERITVGLEQNEFKYNQRRIAEVKYLAELYNYKMVDSPVIFDMLYRVLTFGHEGGTPRPDRYCELDAPDDFFRVRLACVVLETCGMCFDRGSSKKKLDFFLSFFEYYIHTKSTPPMDIEFLVNDTFSLVRPQWQLVTSLEEASQRFAEAVAQHYQAQEADKNIEMEDGQAESSSDDDLDEDEARLPDLEVHTSSEDNEVSAHVEALESQSDEENIVVTRQEEERDPEAEAEFDRELAKLTADSLDSRKFERRSMFDVPLPIRRNDRTPVDAGKAAETSNPVDTMAFSLLTKKGNRQQTRTVDMPADSSFAVAMKTKQQAERDEQKRIKDLVLNYDLRSDDQEIADRGSLGQPRLDRTSFSRNQGRNRKLQMNNMDWT